MHTKQPPINDRIKGGGKKEEEEDLLKS